MAIVRITLELRNCGFVVNQKKVQRLMKSPWFKLPKFVVNASIHLTKVRLARKQIISSNDNLKLQSPTKKCYTDITEFAIPVSSQKLYLSPVLDGYNSEIIAYQLSTSPNLEQVKAMLDQSFTEEHYENTILHSDQGWQYQHQFYHDFLKQNGIRPSMSHKGNSPDNGMMESFFGVLSLRCFMVTRRCFTHLSNWNKLL